MIMMYSRLKILSGIKAFRLLFAGIIGVYLLLDPFHLEAEGTFELKDGTNANPDIVLESPASTFSLSSSDFNLNLARSTTLFVDVLNPNEVIDIYTNRHETATDIEIWFPSSNPDTDPPDVTFDVQSGGDGHITSWQDVLDVQSLSTRPKAPITFTSSAGTGVYAIKVNGPNNGRGNNAVRYFDIMVRDTKGTNGQVDDNLRRGRLWTDHLALSSESFQNQMFTKLFIVDGENKGTFFEGFLWKANLNGIAPFGFHMYVNRRGAHPEEHHLQSVDESASPTPQMVPKFPMYFNFPDKPVVNPEIPKVSNLIFDASCSGTDLQGGNFEFDTNGDWDFEIAIDENNDGTFDRENELAIQGTASEGSNSVPWDGKFKDGTDAPNGTEIKITLRTRASEIHFPFFDVENQPGDAGPDFELLPSDNPTSRLFFWDDTLLPNGTKNLSGTTTPHVWGSNVDGNVRIIDTWKTAFFDIQELQAIINCSDANLIMNKVVDVPQPFEGQQIEYLLRVLNGGPNQALAISVDDVLPSGISYVSDDGMGDYDPGAGVWDVNDLNPGDADSLRITAQVDNGTSGSTIKNIATINTAALGQNDNDTSNNADSADVKVGVFDISGNVFEDIFFGGAPGRSSSTLGTQAIEGVTVELYNADNGNFLASQVTDFQGNFTFEDLPNGNYKVRVVNSTVTTTRTGGSSANIGVQTFRTDYDGTNIINITNEIGGTDPSRVDASANTTSADFSTLSGGNVVPQTVSDVTVSDETISNLQFGFNFNTVVNTNDSGQGSLRQALKNVNDLDNGGLQQDGLDSDFEHIIFNIPTSDPNYDGSKFTITPASNLPDVTDSFTNVNGSTQTDFSGNTNNAVAGESTGPEVVINGSGISGPILNVLSEGLTVEGIGLEQSAGTGSDGVAILYNGVSASKGTVENSTISANNTHGILAQSGANQIQVLSSVFFDNGKSLAGASGLLKQGGDGSVITNSTFASNSGNGITLDNGVTNTQVNGNTFQDNGTGGSGSLAGLAVLDASGTSVINNDFQSNAGDGVLVASGTKNTISQNSTSQNGDLGIDLGSGSTGDGVTRNDTDDTDSGPNELFNFPIIETAQIQDGNLVITGFARPGSVIEVFEADQGNNDFGEGADFLFTVTEGSVDDQDGSTDTYSGNINGIDQGQDNTERYQFVVQNPPGIVLNDELTVTATDGDGNTSEFSGRVIVEKALPDVKGFAFEDANHNKIKDGPGEGGTGLTLFAKLISSGTVDDVASVNGSSGEYTFSGVSAGNYNVIIDDNNNTGDGTPNLPSGWIPTKASTAETGTFTVGVNDVNNLNIGLFNGSLVEGLVINDNGSGGGTANDGLQNGGETGLSGIDVRAMETSGNAILDKASTQTDGSYQLWIPDAQDGTTIAIQELQNSFISTGGDAGTTGGSYNRNNDEITFTNSSGAQFTDLIMANVRPNIFEADMQRDILEGTVTFVPHQYRAQTDGDITFTITDEPSPNIEGWSAQLYSDRNGDGELQTGEPRITTPVSATAGDEINLLAKYTAPVHAGVGSGNLFTITAQFDYNGATPALQKTLEVEDLITINDENSAGLELKKEVDKNAALPGSQLTYTITYTNLSSEAISSVEINDDVPAFTEFSSAGSNTLGDGLTGVNITAPSVGDTGSITWTFTGSLKPGASGTVTYVVTIEN